LKTALKSANPSKNMKKKKKKRGVNAEATPPLLTQICLRNLGRLPHKSERSKTDPGLVGPAPHLQTKEQKKKRKRTHPVPKPSFAGGPASFTTKEQKKTRIIRGNTSSKKQY